MILHVKNEKIETLFLFAQFKKSKEKWRQNKNTYQFKDV